MTITLSSFKTVIKHKRITICNEEKFNRFVTLETKSSGVRLNSEGKKMRQALVSFFPVKNKLF